MLQKMNTARFTLSLLRACASTNLTCARSAATSITKKIIPTQKDESFVESDTEKLSKHACVNYLIDVDGPGPEILPDSNYPDWLFQLDLRPKRQIEDMDPDVDGWAYWLAYKEREKEELERFEKIRYRYLYLQRSPSIKKNRKFSRYAYL